MKYEWIDSYLLAKAGISKNLQTEWNWIRYVIDGKMCVAAVSYTHLDVYKRQICMLISHRRR